MSAKQQLTKEISSNITAQNNYLGPIGTLQSPFDSAVGYQVADLNGQTNSYLFTTSNQINEKGLYNYEIWEVGFAGSLLSKTPSFSNNNCSFFYDVLNVVQIPYSTNSPLKPISSIETNTTSDSELSFAFNRPLLFSHTLEYDSGNKGYYTATNWMNPDGSLGEGEYEIFWENPCPNVATFELNGTVYLWAQTDQPNKDNNNYYDWNIYRISSKGELGEPIASGSWIYSYNTCSFFTAYTKESDGTYTPSVYFYASSSNTNPDEHNSYYWCITEVTYSSTCSEFFADDAIYGGFTPILYEPGILLQNPVSGNIFMFMIHKNATNGLYPWRMIQVTDGSNISSTSKTGSTTLIEPTYTPNIGAFMDYATFISIPTNGLSYLFASTDIVNAQNEYFYTIQTLMENGELIPSSITAQYLQEMLIYTSKTNAYSKVMKDMSKLNLITGKIAEYVQEINDEQDDLQEYTSDWLEQYDENMSTLLTTYQNNESNLNTYAQDLNDIATKCSSFSNNLALLVTPSYQGKTMSSEQWVKACASEVNKYIQEFDKIQGSSNETLIELVNNIKSLLSTFKEANSSFNSNLLFSYADNIDKTSSKLNDLYSEIYKLEYGSGSNAGLSPELTKLYSELNGNVALLKDINTEMQQWLGEVLSLVKGSVVPTTLGTAGFAIAIRTSVFVAGGFFGFVVSIGTLLYKAEQIREKYSALESQQEKLVKKIASQKEQIKQITGEIFDLRELTLICKDLNTNIKSVTTSLTNATNSLTDIEDQLQNISQNINLPQEVESEQVITWLNAHSKMFPNVKYSDDLVLNFEDCYNWSEKVGAQVKAMFSAVPANLSGITSSLQTLCQQAQNLKKTFGIQYTFTDVD